MRLAVGWATKMQKASEADEVSEWTCACVSIYATSATAHVCTLMVYIRSVAKLSVLEQSMPSVIHVSQMNIARIGFNMRVLLTETMQRWHGVSGSEGHRGCTSDIREANLSICWLIDVCLVAISCFGCAFVYASVCTAFMLVCPEGDQGGPQLQHLSTIAVRYAHATTCSTSSWDQQRGCSGMARV